MTAFQHRRMFLAQAARLTSLAALALAFPGTAISRTDWYPFRLGVASGSPRADSIVLWTRLSASPLSNEAFTSLAATVRWEMADDENFRRIVAKGEATALPELALSIHVDVQGLQADRWYWYRFMLGEAVSPVGRTRTAPAAYALPAALRVAVASCQHWEFGHYAAHRHIAAVSPDLVLFLGDYIYEWGPYDVTHPAAPRKRSNESFTLDDYRLRYAQYKSDPDLQAAHRIAPWILTWDDHEVANDYANDRDERLETDFLQRRAAAYQAFYEHMPIRLSPLPAGADRFAYMRMYERYDWGRLARFNVLDGRQYRSYQACQKPQRGGSNTITNSCSERFDPSRSLLGMQQESWLADGLATTDARWNVIAQQTLMAQSSQVAIQKPGDGAFWNDGWDGYPAARTRLLESIARERPDNPLVLSGDVHTFYAAQLRRNFDEPVTTGNPVLATEFCGTSVSSSSRPQERTDQYLAQNSHITYGRSDRRGYMLMNITPTQTHTQFMGLDDVHDARSGIKSIAEFLVRDGQTNLNREA
jgi:alkaline phosphatase D